jgi:hypothetical protein
LATRGWAAVGAGFGVATATAAEKLTNASVAAMGSIGAWIKRLVVGGTIYLGGGVPPRAKGSENPPEIEQPAKPTRPDEQEPDKHPPAGGGL